MATLRVLYSDPRVEVVRRPGRLWLISGVIGAGSPPFDPGEEGNGAAEAAFCHELGDATVLRVDFVEDRPARVLIWRGDTSSYEAYFAIRDSGDVIIADHFRNVVSLLPVDERQPSEASTIDHFVFRRTLGRDTYCANIRRAAFGETVDIDVPSGEVRFSIFDRLVSRLDPRPTEDYVGDLDRALRREMEALRTVPGAVTMLSGGMDSTLMQSYLGDDLPALHVVADADDFHLGGGHLEAAATALGIEPRRAVVPTGEFLDQIEEAVDGRGVPPHFPQWVTLSRVFSEPFEVFIIGERAGAYSRFGGKIPYLARRFSHLPGSLLQPVLRAASTFSRPHRLTLLAQQAPLLGRDPRSPEGWGAQMPLDFGDRRWAEKVFGHEAVLARYEEQLRYVEEHVELLPTTADSYFRHLEIGRWREFYNENNSQFRSLAFAYGKSMVDPFTARSVVDAVLAVPAMERFESGAHSKYIVETLLRQRVPGYPPAAKKDDIVVPFRRYLNKGPLAGVWEKYDVPAFFTGEDRANLIERPGRPSWTAVTWAVWQDRVVNNPGLAPLPTSFDQVREIAPSASGRRVASERGFV